MSKTTKTTDVPICRTCLTYIKGPSFKLHEMSGLGKGLKFTHVLRFVVPELYLGLSHGPEICFNCKYSIQSAYTFRKKCLETEKLIGNYLRAMRCTAQVVDLRVVMGYLENLKANQNSQDILSEWNDDISEDNPRLQPNIEVLPAPETAMNLPEINITPIPATRQKSDLTIHPTILDKNNPPPLLIRKLKLSKNPNKYIVPQLETTRLLYPVPHLKSMQALNSEIETNKEISKIVDSDQIKRIEVLKVCPKTGLFVNKAGTYFNSKGETLPSEAVQTMQTSENKQPTDASQQEEQQLETCIETGLLKNDKGEYFDCLGTRLTQQQVEAERIKVKAENEAKKQVADPISRSISLLKKAKNILQKNDNNSKINDTESQPLTESEENNVSTSVLNKEQNEAENVKKLRDFRKEKTLIICEETGLFKDAQGNYFDFSKNPLNDEEVEAERKKAAIRGETLFKISNICTVSDADFEKTTQKQPDTSLDFEEDINAHQIEKTEKKKKIEFVKIPIDKSSEKHQKKSVVEKNKKKQLFAIKKVPIAHSSENQKQKSKIVYKSYFKKPRKNLSVTKPPVNQPPVSILNFMADKNLRIPQQWNSELQNQKDDTNTALHRMVLIKKGIHQDTANQADDNILHTNRIKEEPLDEFELGNYDVIAEAIDSKDDEETRSIPDINNDTEVSSWQTLINSFDSVENNQYVDVPDFVEINNFTIEDLEDMKNQVSIMTRRDRRKKCILNWFNEILTNKIKKTREEHKSSPDRTSLEENVMVKYKNGFKVNDTIESDDFKQEHTEDPLKLDTEKQTLKIETPHEPDKKRRRRIKLVPNVVSKPIVETKPAPKSEPEHEPDRQVCVLFTNYTEEGVYVNDHDYLTSPYVRNKMLFNKEGQSYCICFICERKHLLKTHISHMKAHSPECPICQISMGTSYMLNLHMRNHWKPCKLCTEMIPYPKLEQHAKEHLKEELLEEEKIRRKKRYKTDLEDDMEVHFPGVHSNNPRKRSTRILCKNTNPYTEVGTENDVTSETYTVEPTKSLRGRKRRSCDQEVLIEPKQICKNQDAYVLLTPLSNEEIEVACNRSIECYLQYHNNFDEVKATPDGELVDDKTEEITKIHESVDNTGTKTENESVTAQDETITNFPLYATHDATECESCPTPTLLTKKPVRKTKKKRQQEVNEKKVQRTLRSSFKKKDEKNGVAAESNRTKEPTRPKLSPRTKDVINEKEITKNPDEDQTECKKTEPER